MEVQREDLEGAITLSGPIVLGDLEKLVRELLSSGGRLQNRGATYLWIDSPGGSVSEAIRIASVVKTLHVPVVVLRPRHKEGAKCASACFFIFLAGSPRVAQPYSPESRVLPHSHGVVGLHRPYLNADFANGRSAEAVTSTQRTLMSKIRDYLSGENVPQRLIDSMMTRPSNEVYWLQEGDLNDLGEYPPDVEEVLIARCGYSRSWQQALVDATLRLDSATEKHYMDLYGDLYRCEERTFPQSAALDRLAAGWRPKGFD
jgi:hypothetical protein